MAENKGPEGIHILLTENRSAPITDNTPAAARQQAKAKTINDPDALKGAAWDPHAAPPGDEGGGSRLVDKIIAEKFGADTSGYKWRHVQTDSGRIHKTFADTHFGFDPSRFAGDSVFMDKNGDEFIFAWLPVPGGLPMKGWGVRHGAFGTAPRFTEDLALGILEVARQDPALAVPSFAPSADASKESRDVLFLAAMRLNIEDAIDAAREGRPARFIHMNYQPEPAIQAQYEAMFSKLSPEEQKAFELARCTAMSKLYSMHGPAEKAQYYADRVNALKGDEPEAQPPQAAPPAGTPPTPPAPPGGGSGGGGGAAPAAPLRPTLNDTVHDAAADQTAQGKPAQDRTEPMPPRQPVAPTVIDIPLSQVDILSRPAPTIPSGEIVPRERTVITTSGESVPSTASPLAKSMFANPPQLPGKTPPALPPAADSGPPPSGPKRLGPPSP